MRRELPRRIGLAAFLKHRTHHTDTPPATTPPAAAESCPAGSARADPRQSPSGSPPAAAALRGQVHRGRPCPPAALQFARELGDVGPPALRRGGVQSVQERRLDGVGGERGCDLDGPGSQGVVERGVPLPRGVRLPHGLPRGDLYWSLLVSWPDVISRTCVIVAWEGRF